MEQEQVEFEVFVDGKPLPVSGWENVWGEIFAKEGRTAAVQLLLDRADVEHQRELGIVRTIEKSHRRPLPVDIPQTLYEIELRKVAAEVALIDPARVTLKVSDAGVVSDLPLSKMTDHELVRLINTASAELMRRAEG